MSQFVGNKDGTDLGELQLFCESFSGNRLLKSNDDRRHNLVRGCDFDLVERLDRVEVDGPSVLSCHLFGASPLLLQDGELGFAGSDPLEACCLNIDVAVRDRIRSRFELLRLIIVCFDSGLLLLHNLQRRVLSRFRGLRYSRLGRCWLRGLGLQRSGNRCRIRRCWRLICQRRLRGRLGFALGSVLVCRRFRVDRADRGDGRGTVRRCGWILCTGDSRRGEETTSNEKGQQGRNQPANHGVFPPETTLESFEMACQMPFSQRVIESAKGAIHTPPILGRRSLDRLRRLSPYDFRMFGEFFPGPRVFLVGSTGESGRYRPFVEEITSRNRR